MRRHPQVMINVPAPDRGASLDGASLEQAIALAEAELGDGGRVLVRPSGTEPLIRVMVESETEADSQRHAEALAEAALGDRGRVLVRPSGTEPLIRVMVESETEADSQRHAEAVADAVRIALR